MILDFRRTRRRKDAARLVAAEKRRKCVSAYVMDIGLMCGQARDAHIFIFAVIEVARFQDESFPVIDLVIFQHVYIQRFFVSEGHSAARFAARGTRQAFLEAAADKQLVVCARSMPVVFALHRS